MDIENLENIGLKEKEMKVYIALLKEGPSLANQLSKKTDILRSSIYDYLDSLLNKGFISYTIKSGKKYFQSIDPQKLLDNFDEKKNKEEKALKELIPKLAELQNISKKKAEVEIFEGKEGMKSVFSRILKDNPKELQIYGSSGGVSRKILPFYMKHWHNARIKNKINVRIIYNDVPNSNEKIKKSPPMKYMQIRFMPIENFSLTGTIIYDNKVLITMWNPETPLAISIESKEIYEGYKDNFEVLWKIAKSN